MAAAVALPAQAVTFQSAVTQGATVVTHPFGGSTAIAVAGSTAALNFNTPEWLDVEIGNPLGTTLGAIDWTLVGLQAGDRIHVSVGVVPEPGSDALMLVGLAGLAGLGFIARRRASRPALQA